MKILLLSTNDFSGAGKATLKVLSSLREAGINCTHKTLIKDSKNLNIKAKINTFLYLLKRKFETLLCKITNTKISDTKSLSFFSTNLADEINDSDFDLVHLTWINDYLSIEDIGKINKPIVWSLCDMWPISGINHYDDYSSKAFWKSNNFLKHKFQKFNLNKWIINRKIKCWNNKNINFVSPSQWLLDCTKSSVITKEHAISKISWPIDRKIYKKIDKLKVRKKFNIPDDKKIIIFNSFSGIYNKRKGWDLFIKSIKNINLDFEIIVIGNEKNMSIEAELKKKIYWMGKFDDDNKIAEIMNCGNLFLLPSRVDNLPQTGLEAQSCGLPIITFNVNGLKDLVEHKKDGFLAEPYDVNSLSEGISWVLSDNNIENELSINALKKAENQWDSKKIGLKYFELYSNLLQTR